MEEEQRPKPRPLKNTDEFRSLFRQNETSSSHKYAPLKSPTRLSGLKELHTKKASSRNRKTPFRAYLDAAKTHEINVELHSGTQTQISVDNVPHATRSLKGNFNFENPTRFKLFENGALWKQFFMDDHYAVPFRLRASQCELRLSALERPTVKPPANVMISAHCIHCSPEPTHGKMSNRPVTMTFNNNGVYFDAQSANGKSLFRAFIFKDTKAQFHSEDDENFMELNQDGGEFLVKFQNASDFQSSRKIVEERTGPTAVSPYFPKHAEGVSNVSDVHTNGTKRKSPYGEIRPTEFYRSKQPRSQSSPLASPTTSRPPSPLTFRPPVSPAPTRLASPQARQAENLNSEATPNDPKSSKSTEKSATPAAAEQTVDLSNEVSPFNAKPSRKTRRVRGQINLATLEDNLIIEPTDEDIVELEKKGHKPLSYRFFDGKAVRVNLSDIVRLNSQIYLNDTIIWFYQKLFLERFVKTNPEKGEGVLMLDTFFYYTMRSLQREPVPSWVKKIPFAEKPVIFVPIHDNSHWALAVILDLDRTIKETETEAEVKEMHRPDIVLLDSLGNHGAFQMARKVIKAVRVAMEAQDLVQLMYKDYRLVKTDAPTQDNLTDCGVFLLHYIERILNQFDTFVEKVRDSTEKTISFSSEFWQPEALSGKREAFKEELQALALSDANKLEDALEDHSDDDIVVIE